MPIKVNIEQDKLNIHLMNGDWDNDLEKVQALPGRSYKNKIWTVESTQVEDVLSKWSFDQIFYCNKETELKFKAFLERDMRPLELLAPIDIPFEGTVYPLKEYQERFIRLNESINKALLSLPQGAGKTLTILERVKILKKVGQITGERILIVVPKRVRTNWQTWVRMALGKESLIYWGTAKQREKLRAKVQDYEVIICTYQTSEELHALMKLKYDHIIVDECHLVSRGGSNRYKGVKLPIEQNPSAGTWLLSGTPIQHKPKDLWGPMSLIAPTVAGSEKSWQSRYERVVRTIKKQIPMKRNGNVLRDENGLIRYREIEIPIKTVTQNLDEMSRRIAPYIFRVSKDEVFEFDSVIEPVFIEMTAAQRRLYNQIKDEIIVELQEKTLNLALAPVRMGRLLQAAEGIFNFGGDGESSKLDYCKEYIDELEDETCIIWSRFQPMTFKLQEALPDKVVVYNGQMPDYMNQLAIWAFNGCADSIELAQYNDLLKKAEKAGRHFPFGPGEAKVFAGVMDLLSALGIDLHRRCNRQLLTSFSFMGAVNDQAMARLIRLGQKSDLVLTQPLLTVDTIEAAAWKLSLTNFQIGQSILDGKESIDVRHTQQLINLLTERIAA